LFAIEKLAVSTAIFALKFRPVLHFVEKPIFLPPQPCSLPVADHLKAVDLRNKRPFLTLQNV
jgi:hypothetical protein